MASLSEAQIALNKVKEMAPANLTLAEFTTYLSCILCIVFYFSGFHLIEFNTQTLSIINNIWNFKNVFFLFIIVALLKLSDFFLWEVKFRYRFKYDVVEWRVFNNRVCHLFSAFMSTFLLVLLIEHIDGNLQQLEEWNYYFVAIFAFIMFFHFIFLNVDIFKEDTSSEYRLEKRNYLNKTIKKFEKEKIEEIQKRLYICQLYEETSKLYDQGVKLDGCYFAQQEQLERLRKQNAERQEEMTRRMNEYTKQKRGGFF